MTKAAVTELVRRFENKAADLCFESSLDGKTAVTECEA